MELILKLNARLQPKHRFDLEDELQEVLAKEQMGEVTGGGTLLNQKLGEITSCDIEIYLDDGNKDNINRLIKHITQLGVPKGSVLSCAEPEFKVEVGTLEGLAYYSNGTELPKEVYENCDINFVIDQMNEAMEGIGHLYSYWEASEWIALYFYGTSFAEMKQKIEPFIASYPLCQKCRIEQIA